MGDKPTWILGPSDAEIELCVLVNLRPIIGFEIMILSGLAIILPYSCVPGNQGSGHSSWRTQTAKERQSLALPNRQDEQEEQLPSNQYAGMERWRYRGRRFYRIPRNQRGQRTHSSSAEQGRSNAGNTNDSVPHGVDKVTDYC